MAHLSSSQGGGEVPDRRDSYYWIPPPPEDQPQAFTFDRRSIADRRATGTEGQPNLQPLSCFTSAQHRDSSGILPNLC